MCCGLVTDALVPFALRRQPAKVVDGIDALPDENTQARQYRNGAGRPCIQHETGNEHSGRWRIDGSDPSIGSAPWGTWPRLPTLNIAFLHSLDPKRTLAAPVGIEPEVGLTHQVLAITLG
jgi:hypothetical protein